MKNIFKIKKEERIPGLVALLVFVLLNGLFFYKYGKECVCQIITFGTMAAGAVIKDVRNSITICGNSFNE